ncbi:MAG TPA: serine hydrolase domain-containing protein [Spirochaetota bacterium]|nr:serine hydrolase domain-containing protein [Spirochaetota bacterium]
MNQFALRILLYSAIFAPAIITSCAHFEEDKKNEVTNIKDALSFSFDAIKTSGNLNESQEFSSDEENELEKILDQIMEKSGHCGYSVAVGIPDRGFWSSQRSIKKTYFNDVSSDAKFHIASIGKIFTSVTIYSLVEKGLLKLDDKIDKRFPHFPNACKISVLNLLNHTSGIETFEILKEYRENNRFYFSPIELLEIANTKEFTHSPGLSYSYTNSGYVALGLIAEKATNKKYNELINETIINPLSLSNTVVITKENASSVIKLSGHNNGEKLEPNEHYANPFSAGTIASTPSDMIKFLHSLYSGKIIKPESLVSMHNNMNATTLEKPNTYYGQGIMLINETPSGNFFGHSGGFPGFYSGLYYHPKKNLFIAVTTNDYKKAVEPAIFMLADFFK